MAMACASSWMAASTTSCTLRSWPRWITSQPEDWMIRRMMLMAASCPSKSDAAVTMRTLCLGLYGSTAFMSLRKFLLQAQFSEIFDRPASVPDRLEGHLIADVQAGGPESADYVCGVRLAHGSNIRIKTKPCEYRTLPVYIERDPAIEEYAELAVRISRGEVI